ncbi:MAG: hypothetical protein LBG96_16655 [Tannerella sp.]|jgi:radical SAM superfamily enzyme YgiQ (UPF0313 family)|nr:hypothetical protein [Tannerella sp.]
MKIIRIFPRQTNATPDDADVRINAVPSLFDDDDADEVHISVTFTWDLARADYLARAWRPVAPVRVGGPAYNEPGGNFAPGMYMKRGYVITSRGCPNRCFFCNVPKREGYRLRELPVTNGWIVTDDNLLACSQEHIDKVFAMLRRQPHRPRFVGGLEAKLMTADMALRLKDLNPVTMFFAYDTPDDYEPLVEAGKYLRAAGFKKSNQQARCYVLIGYKGDAFEKAEKRLKQTWDAGFFPFAMLYRGHDGLYDRDWKRFQREWANPVITGSKLKQYETI